MILYPDSFSQVIMDISKSTPGGGSVLPQCLGRAMVSGATMASDSHSLKPWASFCPQTTVFKLLKTPFFLYFRIKYRPLKDF
jgi:hypothetical protein